eukprot:TRINITY_DN14879_c0_g1_i1.p1 TRINITY_DN14879_c0_g1~~TRINITY_DN14879_c0_g1_i1.p1  ORF type:complete len:984 (-),score=261.24 TRINITY_DN14879_c0_g1_i1:3-2954(-)
MTNPLSQTDWAFIRETFSTWDSISQPKNTTHRYGSILLGNFIGDDVVHTMKQIAARLKSLKSTCSSWAQVFHKRMLATGTITTQDQIDHYLETLSVLKLIEHTLYQELSSFMNSHRVDIDNVLIGLTPSQKAISSLFDNQNLNVSAGKAEKKKTKKLGIGIGKDPSTRSSNKIKAGELALHLPNGVKNYNGAIFARIAKDYDKLPQQVLIFTNPDEVEKISAELPQIEFINPSLHFSILSVRQAEELVIDDTDVILKQLQETTRKKTDQFMKAEGIDIVLIAKLLSPNAEERYSDIFNLRRSVAVLAKLAEPSSPLLDAFLSDLSKTILAESEHFLSNVPKALDENKRFFEPNMDIRLDKVKTAHESMSDYVRAYLSARHSRALSALEGLMKARDHILSGKAKAELVDWWLDLIDKQVKKHLQGRGYNFETIPEDYLEKAPGDLSQVRKNLRIIRRVLADLSSTSYGAIHILLDDLKSEILPRIDWFLLDLLSLLALRQAELHSRALNRDCPWDLATPNDLLGEESPPIDQEFRLAIQSGENEAEVAKDVEYLREMRKMEEDPDSLQRMAGAGVENIVPISGLIVGWFYRLENECHTVLDLWSDEDEDESEDDEAGISRTNSRPSHVSSPTPSPLAANNINNNNVNNNNNSNVNVNVNVINNNNTNVLNLSTSSINTPSSTPTTTPSSTPTNTPVTPSAFPNSHSQSSSNLNRPNRKDIPSSSSSNTSPPLEEKTRNQIRNTIKLLELMDSKNVKDGSVKFIGDVSKNFSSKRYSKIPIHSRFDMIYQPALSPNSSSKTFQVSDGPESASGSYSGQASTSSPEMSAIHVCNSNVPDHSPHVVKVEDVQNLVKNFSSHDKDVLYNVHKRFSPRIPDIIKFPRKLLGEGDLFLWLKDVKKTRYYQMFNDIMLISRKLKNRQKLRLVIWLNLRNVTSIQQFPTSLDYEIRVSTARAELNLWLPSSATKATLLNEFRLTVSDKVDWH